MQQKSSMLTKCVGAVLFFLTVISTAVVVVQACHNEPSAVAASVSSPAHVSHGDHFHATPANSVKAAVAASGVLNSGLITDLCTGIFYLVLIFGARFLLRILHNSKKERILAFKVAVLAATRKLPFNLTLSLPQLGISRI